MKLGLITLHRWFNYGSMLQAYALNRILNELDECECELIDYTPPKIDNNRSYKLYNDLPEYDTLRMEYKDQIEQRKESFNKFMELYVCGKERYGSDEELEGNPPAYDKYITGSDQVWNVNMRIASRAYFLSFTDSKEKYAFATSCGRCKEDSLQEYQQYIAKYKRILMREKDGAETVDKLVENVNIDTMIDPTLILSTEQWNDIIGRERLIPTDYIACYATLDDELNNMMPLLEEIHKCTGKTVVLFGMVMPRVESWIQNVVEAGPIEMVKLIKEADLVFTHSFHGTAFSVNYNVPFLTYNDELENPRKEGLLRELGLQDRIVHNVEECRDAVKKSCDFSNANEILNEKREEAYRKIKDCVYGD